MLSTDMNNLKYVALEIIKNPGTKLIDVECGAFMGLVVHKNDAGTDTTFIVLQNSEKSIRMYNISDYGVMTIQAETPEMKYMTVFTKNDQAIAINTLKQIMIAMRADNRLYSTTPGNELINVDSYVGMPDVVFTGNNLSSSVTDRATTTSHTHTVGGNSANTATQAAGYTTYTPAKPTALSFKRKGKLPAEDRLLKMRDMVVAVTDKTVEFIIPIPKCDMPKKADEPPETEPEDHTHTTNSVTM